MADRDDFSAEGEGASPSSAPTPAPKTPRSPRHTLNLALLVLVGLDLGYGLPMLLWPGLLWGTIGGADGLHLEALKTNRWAGALLVGLAIGALFVMARPAGQRTIVTMFAIQSAIAATALVLSAVNGELSGVLDAWFYWLAAVATAATSLYLWYARLKARSVLAPSPPA